MIESLAPMFDFASDIWIAVVLVFVRVGGVMAVLPAFGERSVPVNVRLVLTLAFTAIIFPAAPPPEFASDSPLAMLALPLMSEAIAGLTLGLIVRMTVFALQIAGTIISQSTSLAQLFGGGAVDAQPAMGHLLLVAGLALAASIGLHERIAVYLLESYSFLPVGRLPNSSDLSMLFIGHVSKSFMLAFSFSAPFLIASVVYNTALGVINRAMPQLMVAFVGAPAITLGGLILLFLTAPLLLELWLAHFVRVLENPLMVN